MRKKEQWMKQDIKGMEPKGQLIKLDINRLKTTERWTKQDINRVRLAKICLSQACFSDLRGIRCNQSPGIEYF
jgi:hypothetical protein